MRHHSFVYVAASLISALWLFGCSDEGSLPAPELPAITETEGTDTVDVSLLFHVPKEVAYTQSEGTTDEGYIGERFIKSIEIYFFNSDNGTLEKRGRYEVGELEHLDEIDQYLQLKMKMHKGTYNVYAVANYPELDLMYEDELLNYIDSITFPDGILNEAIEDGIIMTNTASANYRQKVETLPASSGESKLTINMERVFSKISLTLGKDSYPLMHDGKKYATIRLTDFKFVNLNTQFYLFQHTAKLSSFQKQEEYLLPTNFLPQDEEETDQYVIDPLFFLKQNDPESIQRSANLFANSFHDIRNTGFASIPTAGYSALSYILENCSFQTNQLNSYSTGILFKGAVIPNSNVYLLNKKTNKVEVENTMENWPRKLYFYDYKFYGSVKAINIACQTSFPEKNNYSDEELNQYGIRLYNEHMGIYETFFVYWIRHKDNHDPTKMGPMEFGVVRNNYYKMKIANITNLGSNSMESLLDKPNEISSDIDIENP